MNFTTRSLKATPTPEPEAVTEAARELEEIRQRYLKLLHHLDSSETRGLHNEALAQKESADKLSVRLTEFVGG